MKRSGERPELIHDFMTEFLLFLLMEVKQMCIYMKILVTDEFHKQDIGVNILL